MDLLAPAMRLLAIPSTADKPTELHRALEFVLDFVGPGFTVERFESNGKPSALVYANKQRFPVILNGHLDVVPGRADQFVPRIEGDRLYARGAHDMKVAALVEALVFRELGHDLPIALQLVTDEEVGGRDGTKYQLDQGVVGDFVIIGEQSGLRLVTESKGILGANLRATGRAGHSAYPWNADNALLKLMRSIDNLLARYPLPQEEVWQTTINVARIETDNSARNQVPANAEARLDIRFPPEDLALNGRTDQEIVAYLESFCEPGVSASVIFADPPHKADRARAEVKQLQQAARNQGFDGDFLVKHGAADGRFYYQHGIDAVIFGIGGDGLHGPQEYVDITTIEPYYQALREFLLSRTY
ncbi:M20/M25/M40 family metallo-hydrolase [Kibdelosporangium philippinense]|uniref:M20/M25/M40 family metallo-hydrolase n=1 Tax=Kibdelosporangium philippinense TaxID=211113 RepID=A0ABS8Z5G9_9PSEU|nr:M20/M25/M40 family metallo-hydrolase [Kibdelosporangium philippinense]MCE7002747.1 M20/M25/M40 family metallo-hydrolase [Kibdelosporangium philippinense]